MKCENCGCEHDGKYGSGRFCSVKCSRGFSTKAKRSLINDKVRKSLYKGPHKKTCPECGKDFETIKIKQVYCSQICGARSHKDISSKIAKIYFTGNRNNYAHGWYTSPFAGKVYLESSYEYKVAKELDENKIEWIRPEPLNWDGKKYYPDFYLVKENIYLDPKNDYLITKDTQKIEKVKKQNNVEVLILTKDELEWSVIKNKL